MTNPDPKYNKRGILTTEEIDYLLAQADKLPTVYFRLRAKALICLLKKFGKRRSEIARLALKNGEGESDLLKTDSDLIITFTLSKKHKLGLHQYFKYCSKQLPQVLELPLPEIKAKWKEWQLTEKGHTSKLTKAPHSIALNDRYAEPVLKYIQYISSNYPTAKFLFPSGTSVFGGGYVVYPDKHLTGRQLLRIVKQLKSDVWLHLFRETKGAAIAVQYGRTLSAIYEVKDTLDLENEETAYRYVRRYASKRENAET